METFISKFVDLLKASPRVWAALTIAGLCVVIPSRWQHFFGLDDLRAHYLSWITLLTIIFAFLLLMSAYDKAAQAFSRRRNRKREELSAADDIKRADLAAADAAIRAAGEIESAIRALSPGERLVLAYFVATQEQTLELSDFDDYVDRLTERGMLEKFGSVTRSWRAAYAIKSPIYAFLNQNRSIIDPELRELERRSDAGEPLY